MEGTFDAYQFIVKLSVDSEKILNFEKKTKKYTHSNRSVPVQESSTLLFMSLITSWSKDTLRTARFKDCTFIETNNNVRITNLLWIRSNNKRLVTSCNTKQLMQLIFWILSIRIEERIILVNHREIGKRYIKKILTLVNAQNFNTGIGSRYFLFHSIRFRQPSTAYVANEFVIMSPTEFSAKAILFKYPIFSFYLFPSISFYHQFYLNIHNRTVAPSLYLCIWVC